MQQDRLLQKQNVQKEYGEPCGNKHATPMTNMKVEIEYITREMIVLSGKDQELSSVKTVQWFLSDMEEHALECIGSD